VKWLMAFISVVCFIFTFMGGGPLFLIAALLACGLLIYLCKEEEKSNDKR
jgi:4-hydroxybenzoate polyprenyltransferase